MEEEVRSKPVPPCQAGAGGFSWLTALGFAFLTFNSGMAVYRSYHYKAAVAFVVSTYGTLVVLFACLRWFERAPPGSVWALTTTLTMLFSYKVAGIMPVLVQALVWWMAVATTIGGFYALFLHSKGKIQALSHALGRKETGFLLAPLRLHSTEPAGDPRDTAWSRARLIVDSGATTHVVGDARLLEDYQPYSTPLVARLADGSTKRILGVGRIQRGNFSIPDVSLVEGVQDGLISTPQLDARHGLISCFGNGICRIMEANGTVVGGAFLDGDNSYVLSFLEVPGTATQV